MITKHLPVYTIGHSTHPLEEFIELLKLNEIQTLADIRTIPKSRYNPQFTQASLEKSLAKAGINYRYMKNLGGLRTTRTDSINMGWRNTSFRGYADYMQTPEFTEAIGNLVKLSKTEQVAIMCAEAVPWRCHRSLVGDALLVRRIKVLDIMSKTSNKEHTLTRFAKTKGMTITYPPESNA